MTRKVSSFALAFITLLTAHYQASAADRLDVWREFAAALKSGTMTLDRIRPMEELGDDFKPILFGYLQTLATEADSQDWSVQPEIIQIGNQIKCIFPWVTKGQKISYCFSFVTDDSTWYFQHLEAIFIRLDKVPPLPISQFPDISESQKAWAREEIYWSFLVMNIYLPVSKEMGKQRALDLFKDGIGYFVAAKAWVPFVSPPKSFVLYLCWEQANLRGNLVTLEKLEDNEAVVRLNAQFFQLYFMAAHFKPIIPIDEYREIFETIWLDRASSAGWNLKITYADDYGVTLCFSR